MRRDEENKPKRHEIAHKVEKKMSLIIWIPNFFKKAFWKREGDVLSNTTDMSN